MLTVDPMPGRRGEKDVRDSMQLGRNEWEMDFGDGLSVLFAAKSYTPGGVG